MQLLTKLGTLLAGDSRNVKMEQRIYNLFSFALWFSGFVDILINYFMGLHLLNVVLALGFVLNNVVGYYLSRIRGVFNMRLLFVTAVVNCIFLCLGYYTTAGRDGNHIFMLFVGSIVYYLIGSRPYNAIMFFVFIGGIYFVYFSELAFPEWVIAFDTPQKRAEDFLGKFTNLWLLLFIIFYIYKGNYDLEHRQLVAQTEELQKRNAFVQTLLRELNHRVKNNLQVVSSLLGMQAYRTEDPRAAEALQVGKNRLTSMALLHKKLYQEEHYHTISLYQYLDDLIEHLLADTEQHIAIHVNRGEEDAMLLQDQAVPFGLVVNEVMTNVLKHAFATHHSSAAITISCGVASGRVELAIADNGKGMKQHPNNKESFGLELISLLVKQLEGSWSMTPNPDGGTLVSVSFPLMKEPVTHG